MPPRPSVLQVVQPPDGGVATHVLGLTLGLVERGFHVEVATSASSVIAPALRDAGIAVHHAPLTRAPGPRDVAAARTLRALDSRGGFGVVHAHSSKAGALVRGALPRRRRLVYTPHCFPFAAPFGARRLVYRAAEQALVARSGAIVATCDWERELAARTLVGARSRTRLIYNGVAPASGAAPDAALMEFRGDEPLAGIVTALRPGKEVALALRALARVPGRGRLAIVGNGDLAASIEQEIETIGLTGRARLFPFGGDVAPYLAALDLFVLPTLWEAFPLSVLEAMSCALPVVATDVGGVPEQVADGRTGRLVALGDEAALAGALTELFEDGELRRAWGQAGLAEYERGFRIERMVAELAELYAELA